MKHTIEQAIIPYNSMTGNVIEKKQKYLLFAPVARTTVPGIAAFDSDHFFITGSKVSIASRVFTGISDEIDADVAAAYSRITEETGNKLSAQYTKITGETDGKLSNQYTKITGETDDKLSGQYSTITGETDDKLSGQYSTITKETDDKLSAQYTKITGETDDKLSEQYDRITNETSTTLSEEYHIITVQTDAKLSAQYDRITREMTSEIASKIAEIVANAPDDFDTLKELADWLETHGTEAAEMNSVIEQNVAKLSDLWRLTDTQQGQINMLRFDVDDNKDLSEANTRSIAQVREKTPTRMTLDVDSSSLTLTASLWNDDYSVPIITSNPIDLNSEITFEGLPDKPFGEVSIEVSCSPGSLVADIDFDYRVYDTDVNILSALPTADDLRNGTWKMHVVNAAGTSSYTIDVVRDCSIIEDFNTGNIRVKWSNTCMAYIIRNTEDSSYDWTPPHVGVYVTQAKRSFDDSIFEFYGQIAAGVKKLDNKYLDLPNNSDFQELDGKLVLATQVDASDIKDSDGNVVQEMSGTPGLIKLYNPSSGLVLDELGRLCITPASEDDMRNGSLRKPIVPGTFVKALSIFGVPTATDVDTKISALRGDLPTLVGNIVDPKLSSAISGLGRGVTCKVLAPNESWTVPTSTLMIIVPYEAQISGTKWDNTADSATLSGLTVMLTTESDGANFRGVRLHLNGLSTSSVHHLYKTCTIKNTHSSGSTYIYNVKL